MYIVVDDEKIGADNVRDSLLKIDETAEVTVFNKPSAALEFARENEFDCVFLDISMPGMNGVELAKKLKLLHPKCNIVFTTGFDDYYGDAFSLGASDYLLKPITPEKIKRSLDNLRNPVQKEKTGLVVQCFGDFELFYNGKPVHFGRAKSKELFAYLIYRNGASVTKNDIMANLWEDDNISYYGVVKKDLTDTFRSLGLSDVLIAQWKTVAVNKNAVKCDYYDFLQGVPDAINSFCGEFMTQFSWASDMEAVLCGK